MNKGIYFTILLLFCIQMAYVSSGEIPYELKIQEDLMPVCSEPLPTDFASRLITTIENKKIPLSTLRFIIRNMPDGFSIADVHSLETFLIATARETDLQFRRGEAPAKVRIKLKRYIKNYKKNFRKADNVREHGGNQKNIRARYRDENLKLHQRGKREELRAGQGNGGSGHHGQTQGNSPHEGGSGGNGGNGNNHGA